MIAPPRTIELVLASLGARPHFRDALLGDLAEEFTERARRESYDVACRWYVAQAVRAVPHLLHDWARGAGVRGVARLAGTVLASYVAVAVLVLLILLTARVIGAMLGVEPDLGFVGESVPLAVVVALTAAGLSGAAGGAIAATLKDDAPLVAAAALGLAWACGVLPGVQVKQAGVPVTTWLQPAAGVVLLAGAVVGGVLRVRGNDRPREDRLLRLFPAR